MAVASHISDEDRRSAAAVTVSGSGHKFEIQLGHLCNNRCVFCSSGQLTAMKLARAIPIEPIFEALDQARRDGATHLTFVGGEPTLHKRFADAVAHAVELGFGHIVIFTNGVMFPHPGFLDSIVALGRFEWRISIQGATDEAHVAATGRADSFERILHGLGELQRRGQFVTTNMCVNERSYRSLPHYPELLKRYGVRQLHVDIVRPASTGQRDEAYLRDIMPRYTDMAPFYDAMLDGFERSDPGFDVNIGNLPHCILPQWGSFIHHGGEETVTKSADATGLEDEMNKYEWQESLRTHLPGCADCVFRSRCTGIFRAYLDLYGGDDFQPVTRERLAEIDPKRRNFVLLLEPSVSALKSHAPPQGWTLQAERSDERRREVELVLRHAAIADVTLRWRNPGGGRLPILRCDDYDVEAEADPRIPAQALAELFDWLRTRLAQAEPQRAAPTLAANAVELALRPRLLERGRQRVAHLSGRLAERFALPGWNLDALRWTDDSRAELLARGPASARVALVFTLGTRDARSQVDVDFAPTNCAESTVRTVIETLASLLRTTQPASPQP